MPDNLKNLHKSLSKSYDLPDYEQFAADMQDPSKLETFHKSMSSEFELPEFEAFKKDMLGTQEIEKKSQDNSGTGSDPSESEAPSTELGLSDLSWGEDTSPKKMEDIVITSQTGKAPTSEAIANELKSRRTKFAKSGDAWSPDPEVYDAEFSKQKNIADNYKGDINLFNKSVDKAIINFEGEGDIFDQMSGKKFRFIHEEDRLEAEVRRQSDELKRLGEQDTEEYKGTLLQIEQFKNKRLERVDQEIVPLQEEYDKLLKVAEDKERPKGSLIYGRIDFLKEQIEHKQKMKESFFMSPEDIARGITGDGGQQEGIDPLEVIRTKVMSLHQELSDIGTDQAKEDKESNFAEKVLNVASMATGHHEKGMRKLQVLRELELLAPITYLNQRPDEDQTTVPEEFAGSFMKQVAPHNLAPTSRDNITTIQQIMSDEGISHLVKKDEQQRMKNITAEYRIHDPRFAAQVLGNVGGIVIPMAATGGVTSGAFKIAALELRTGLVASGVRMSRVNALSRLYKMKYGALDNVLRTTAHYGITGATFTQLENELNPASGFAAGLAGNLMGSFGRGIMRSLSKNGKKTMGIGTQKITDMIGGGFTETGEELAENVANALKTFGNEKEWNKAMSEFSNTFKDLESTGKFVISCFTMGMGMKGMSNTTAGREFKEQVFNQGESLVRRAQYEYDRLSKEEKAKVDKFMDETSQKIEAHDLLNFDLESAKGITGMLAKQLGALEITQEQFDEAVSDLNWLAESNEKINTDMLNDEQKSKLVPLVGTKITNEAKMKGLDATVAKPIKEQNELIDMAIKDIMNTSQETAPQGKVTEQTNTDKTDAEETTTDKTDAEQTSTEEEAPAETEEEAAREETSLEDIAIKVGEKQELTPEEQAVYEDKKNEIDARAVDSKEKSNIKKARKKVPKTQKAYDKTIDALSTMKGTLDTKVRQALANFGDQRSAGKKTKEFVRLFSEDANGESDPSNTVSSLGKALTDFEKYIQRQEGTSRQLRLSDFPKQIPLELRKEMVVAHNAKKDAFKANEDAKEHLTMLEGTEQMIRSEKRKDIKEGIKKDNQAREVRQEAQKKAKKAEADIKAKKKEKQAKMLATKSDAAKAAAAKIIAKKKTAVKAKEEAKGDVKEDTDEPTTVTIDNLDDVDGVIPEKASQIKNIITSLSKISPNLEVVLHSNNDTYTETLGGEAEGTNGALRGNSIHLNLSNIDNNTAVHEASHIVLAAHLNNNPAAVAEFKEQLSSILDTADIKSLNEFASKYESVDQNEEFVIEALARIVNNDIKLNASALQKLKEFIQKLLKSLNIDSTVFLKSKDSVIDFAAKLSIAFEEGRVLSNTIVAAKPKDTGKTKFQSFTDLTSKIQVLYDYQSSDAFKDAIANKNLTTDKVLTDFIGEALFHQPDIAFTGTIKRGDVILIEGQGGMYYTIKYMKDGKVWASTTYTAANGMAKMLNEIAAANNGVARMVLVSTAQSKGLSNYNAVKGIVTLLQTKALSNSFNLKPETLKKAFLAADKSMSYKQGEKVVKGIGIHIDNSMSLDTIVEKTLEVTKPENEGVFPQRKAFLLRLAMELANATTDGITVQQLSDFFGEGILNDKFKGTGKTKLAGSHLQQAFSFLMNEPVLRGIEGSHKSYAVIEVIGELDADGKFIGGDVVEAYEDKENDKAKHLTYAWSIKTTNNQRVNLHVLKENPDWREQTKLVDDLYTTVKKKDPKTGKSKVVRVKKKVKDPKTGKVKLNTVDKVKKIGKKGDRPTENTSTNILPSNTGVSKKLEITKDSDLFIITPKLKKKKKKKPLITDKVKVKFQKEQDNKEAIEVINDLGEQLDEFTAEEINTLLDEEIDVEVLQGLIDEKKTKDKEQRKSRPFEKPSGDKEMFEVENFIVGPKKTEANIGPLLNKLRSIDKEAENINSIDFDLLHEETHRIIEEYGEDLAEQVVYNPMAPIALKRNMGITLAGRARSRGEDGKYLKLIIAYKNLGAEAAQGTAVGNMIRKNPNFVPNELYSTVIAQRSENKGKEATLDIDENSDLDQESAAFKKDIEKFAEKIGLDISESETVQKILDKIFSKGKQEGKMSKLPAKVAEARKTRDRFKDKLRGNIKFQRKTRLQEKYPNADPTVQELFDMRGISKADLMEILQAYAEEGALEVSQQAKMFAADLSEFDITKEEAKVHLNNFYAYNMDEARAALEPIEDRLIEQLLADEGAGTGDALRKFYTTAKNLLKTNEKTKEMVQEKGISRAFEDIFNNRVAYSDVINKLIQAEADALGTENSAPDISPADLPGLFSEKIAKKFIRIPKDSKPKLVDKTSITAQIRDVVTQPGKNKKKLLEDLLKQATFELGLSRAEGKALGGAIETQYKEAMANFTRKRLEKLYGKKAVVSKKTKKTKTEKVVDALYAGDFDSRTYAEEVRDSLGIYKFNTKMRKSIDDISEILVYLNNNAAEGLKVAEGGEMTRTLHVKLNDLMKEAKQSSRFKETVDALQSLYFNGMLSAPTTFMRAAIGGGMTSYWQATVKSIGSPYAAMTAMLNIGKIIGKKEFVSFTAFGRVMMTGKSAVNMLDGKNETTGYTDKLFNTWYKLSELKDTETPVLKRGFKAAMMLWYSASILGTRSMIAVDSLYRTNLMPYFVFLNTYNKNLEAAQKKLGVSVVPIAARKAVMETTMKAMKFADKEVRTRAAKQYTEEKAFIEERGMKYDLQKNLRVSEIILQQHDADAVERSLQEINQALLTANPEGNLGTIYRSTSNLLTGKEADNNATYAARAVAKTVIPFLKVALNLTQKGIEHFPVVSQGRALTYQFFKDQRKDAIGAMRDLNPGEVQEMWISSTIGSTMFVALAASLFGHDDEEGIVLKKDSWLEVTGSGRGNYYENKQISPDYQDHSFRISIGSYKSGWIYYKDHAVGMMLNSIGEASDRIRYGRFDEQVKAKEKGTDYVNESLEEQVLFELIRGMFDPILYGSTQTYSQGIETMITIGEGVAAYAKGEKDNPRAEYKIEQMLAALKRRAVDPAKSILYPNQTEYGVKRYKGLKGVTKKEVHTMKERFAEDIPIISDYILNRPKFDELGYEVQYPFGFEFTPDVIWHTWKDNREIKEEQPLWKFKFKPENGVVKYGKTPRADKKWKEYLMESWKEDFPKSYRRELEKSFNEGEFFNLSTIELQAKINTIHSEVKRDLKSVYKKRNALTKQQEMNTEIWKPVFKRED